MKKAISIILAIVFAVVGVVVVLVMEWASGKKSGK